MRFESKETGGYKIYAVTGTNTISFGIDFDNADTDGLLGFGVEREGGGKPKAFVKGYKVFKEVIAKPNAKTEVSTKDHPVQSFNWDDFTCKPGTKYTFYFHPYKGAPGNLDRSAAPIKIQVETEPLYGGKHDVFFNRGVASSQAFTRRFPDVKPADLANGKAKDALLWLRRDLQDALFKFIGQAKKGDTLLGCFYEFHYLPVLKEFKKAIDKGVKVQLVVDCKENATKDKKTGKMSASFPREANLKALKAAKIPAAVVIKREAKPGDIQHNKFVVWVDGKTGKATEVWTGSTNISNGGGAWAN